MSAMEIIDGVLVNCYPDEATLTLPEGVTSIAANAIQENELVRELVLPEGLIHLEKDILNRCRSLRHAVLPASLRSIGASALAVPSLRELTFRGAGAAINTHVFGIWVCHLETITVLGEDEQAVRTLFRKLARILRQEPYEPPILPELRTIHVHKPSWVPAVWRPKAVLGFLRADGELTSPRGEAYARYIRVHGAELALLLMAEPKLLENVCRAELLSAEAVQACLDSLTPQHDFELRAMLMDYALRHLTPAVYRRLAARDERRSTEIVRRAQARLGRRDLRGLTIAVPDVPNKSAFATRTELYRYLWELGAHVTARVSSRVDYVLCEEKNNREAQALNIEMVNWQEFIELTGEIIDGCWVHRGKLMRCLNDEITVRVPEGVTVIGERAFCNMRQMTCVVLPEGVTELKNRAFRYCPALTSVRLPNTLRTIEHGAFFQCEELQCIELPRGVQEVSPYVFEMSARAAFRVDCASAAEYLARRIDARHRLYIGGAPARCVTVPDGMTEISDYAFYNCLNVEEIIIPAGVARVGVSAFSGCKKLRRIVLPDTVTEIANTAFRRCDELRELDLPPKLKQLGAYVFAGCGALHTVRFGAGPEVIREGTFKRCPCLRTLRLPDKLRSIEESAFRNLNLERVDLPPHLQELGPDCFYGCPDLASVTLPAGIKSMGPGALWACEKLAEVIVTGSTDAKADTARIAGMLIKVCSPEHLPQLRMTIKTEEDENERTKY